MFVDKEGDEIEQRRETQGVVCWRIVGENELAKASGLGVGINFEGALVYVS